MYYGLNTSLTEDFWSQDIALSLSVIILRRVFRAVNYNGRKKIKVARNDNAIVR